MPRQSRGPYLWLRPARERDDKGDERATWIIKDAGRQISTRLGSTERREAERSLADYIASKYAPSRRERDMTEIPIADVIGLYLTDVVPRQACPDKAAERCGRLLDFFGERMLDSVTGSTCREYAAWREGKGQSNKGTGGGARRDLQDLAAAIGHHSKEGLHRGLVRVALPPKGKARQRWLTRDEAARLIRSCWRAREIQDGRPTGKRPLRHLARFLLLGIYTGSRPGAILNAAWRQAPGRSWIDTANGVFHRHADGEAESNKRQPSVRLAPRLLAHLRRWERLDAGKQTFLVEHRGAPVASIKTAMASACRAAGIEGDVSGYTLRHTAASWLVARGLPTRLVADFLGTGEQMILSHYGHLAPDYQLAAALAIGSKERIGGGSGGAISRRT